MSLRLIPLLCLGCLTWSAAEEAVIIHGPEDAVQLLIERNQRIEASITDLSAARFRAQSLTAFLRPQVDVSANGGVAGGTRNQAYENNLGEITRYGADGSITQYLFGFGRGMAARNSSAAAIDAVQASVNLTRRDLSYQARVAVANVYLARQLVDIAQRRVEQRRSERDDADHRLQAGVLDGLDLADSQIRVANAEEQLALAKTTEQLALENLATLVNAPITAITVEGALARPGDLNDTVSAALRAVDSGSELARLDAQRRQAAAVARANRADRLPVIAAFAGGDLTGDEVGDLNDGWSAGLRLDWKVYDGGAQGAQAKAAEADAQSAMLTSEAVRRERAANAASIAQRAADLSNRIALKERVLELSRTLYQEIRARYQAGTETLIRVNEANLTVFEAAYAIADLTHQEMVLAAEAQRLAE
jgi:outer membrane protein TolC